MALNYLVDAMDSECVTSIGQERQARSVINHHLMIISRVTNRHRLKEDNTIYDTTRWGDRRIQRSRILNSNSELIHRTKTRHTWTDYISGRNNISNEGWGEEEEERRRWKDQRWISIETRHGVVILIMSRDENDYNLMTNTTTYSSLRVNNKYI